LPDSKKEKTNDFSLLPVLDMNGKEVKVGTLWAGDTAAPVTVLVFLRHFL